MNDEDMIVKSHYFWVIILSNDLNTLMLSLLVIDGYLKQKKLLLTICMMQALSYS